ncbi:regulator of RNase E activity RraA [Crossiella equi]|uniref:Putative 4-hydroxy-4-methyl-2-oxoglutarate aldolase n=1 Tax=Crossiella equi TaxID=130796 RepID=A0ABS5AMY1_9PSEU|nr:dimethylmenaquinone methyltransferase [Crossiella equi]MBP2477916.1 regulator of RNase E activity RraA [Crossiella equi]
MDSTLRRRFLTLTAAHVADGCLRAGVPVRCAPPRVRPLLPGARVGGRVLPARHAGSVDVFLEAFEHAEPGDVLVVDNGGREDEACVGDLVVLEAREAGVSGLVVWGLHRDTADLREIGWPLFSTGSLPTGPLRLDARDPEALLSARVGPWTVTSADVVLGDEDGVLFVPGAALAEVFTAAERIRDTERGQAKRISQGRTLREQVGFAGYLSARAAEPALTFREHLRRVGGAIEE